MALTQEQVDAWFDANPNATAEEIAAAVQSVGGLSANEGLASMIANRYAIAEPEVTNYYNTWAGVPVEDKTAKIDTKVDLPAFTDTIFTGAPTTQEELLSVLADSTVTGGTGNDTIVGATGVDTVVGGTGNDTVVSGTGVDTVVGGATQTQAVTNPFAAISAAWNNGDYAATNAIIASSNLTADDIQSYYGLDDYTMDWVLRQGIKTADQVSTVTGATGNDTVTGLTASDTLTGATGNDVATTYTQTQVNQLLADTLAADSTANRNDVIAAAATLGITADQVATAYNNLASTSSASGYTKPSSTLSGVAGQGAIEGDDIQGQMDRLGTEYASWSRDGDYMILTRKDDNKVIDRKFSPAISDLGLLKTGLSFVPGAGQILALVNVADAIRTGDLTTAAIGLTGLGGFKDVNTALRVLQGLSKDDALAAITALAGNENVTNALGLNNASVAGFTAKDAMAATSLVSSANAGNTAGVITNLGLLAGSSDAVTAGKALSLMTRLKNGDTKALSEAVNFSNSITSSGSIGTTGTTKSTTVGDFEDTEVTRLKGLGYTKEQIQDYFRNLDNLTSNLDTAASTVVGATGNDVTLPTGVQLASTGNGVFRTDVGGVPTYAESANASSVTAPLGYKLLSTSEVENKPAGSYYDITANAWFKPDTAVTDLTGSDTIQADAALFNNSLGTLDQLDANRTSDDFAEFLKTIGITNATQLTDSGLSNQDILDLINAGTDTVTVTGAKGNDTITGANANDGLETVTVTGAKGNDTLTGGTGNDTGTLSCPPGKVPNEAGTACIDQTVITGKRDPCPPGQVYDEDLDKCVLLEQDPCPTGYHRDASGQCVQDDCPDGYLRDLTTGECVLIKGDEPCAAGYERDELTGQCIPVVEIKDKKCDPGFVYDEDLKFCVPITEDPCPTGFHRNESGVCVLEECPDGYVRNLGTGACEKPLDCPEGYEPNEAGTECIPKITIEECKDGKVRDPISGLCVLPPVECDPGYHLENGICVPDEEPCDTGYHRENGVCVPDECEEGYVRNLATGVCEKPLDCPEGYEPNEAGTECIPIIEIKSCPTGFVRDEATGKCVPIADTPCDNGYHLENGICVPDDDPCDEGYHRENGVCVPDECAEGYIRNLETGLCEKVEEKSCPPGQTRNAQGVCVPIVKTPPPIVCPTGFKLVNGACVPIPKTTAMPTMGASGEGEKTDPIYAGGMDSFNLLATLQELLAEEAPKKDDKKSKDKTKMASGGHLDDLLAEQMTVDDLLKLLR